MNRLELDPELAARRIVPPGLDLSIAQPSEYYLRRNFNHDNLTEEDLKGFGAFLVDIILRNTDHTDRISLMPSALDFQVMSSAGYGLTHQRLRNYGGEAKVQRLAEFYPKGFRPERDQLLERFSWMAGHVLRPFHDFDPATGRIRDIISWGTARDILPSSRIVYSVLGGDTSEVQEIFAMEKTDVSKELTFYDVYWFGAKVLRENNGPLNRKELNSKYADVFSAKPSEVLQVFFGGTNKFWLEFDLVVDASGMSDQDAVLLGAREAIKSDTPNMADAMDTLIRDKKLPYRPVRRLGVREFKRRVEADYDAYQGVCDQFEAQGVARDVMRVVCGRKFEGGTEFEAWLQSEIAVLQKISRNKSKGELLLARIENGLGLGSRPVYTWQLEETHKVLQQWGLTDDQKRFVFELIPRINPDEAMAGATELQESDAAISIEYHQPPFRWRD